MRRLFWLPIVFPLFLTGLMFPASRLLADEPASKLQCRGSGEDLEIRLHGEVLNAEGEPADDFTLRAAMYARPFVNPIEIKTDGHRFESWIPVNRHPWYQLALEATSDTGNRYACVSISGPNFRQSAIEGITLRLEPPKRTISVKVVDDGEPVAGAHVQAFLFRPFRQITKTDGNGVAVVSLFEGQDFDRLLAWTDDRRVGGFFLREETEHDPTADEQTIEILDCRDQVFRLVDGEGNPAPGVKFEVTVRRPDYLKPPYIQGFEQAKLTTDASGVAIFRWMPEGEDMFPFIKLLTERWWQDGFIEEVDDEFLMKLKPRTERKRVQGQIHFPEEASPGVFFVEFRSFQSDRGENYTDPVRVVSDEAGRFEADILPDATYCVYLNNAVWLSSPIGLIPYVSETGKRSPIELTAHKGQKLEIVTTQGENKKPFRAVRVHVRSLFNYSWSEEGRTRRDTNGPQSTVITDSNGRATIRVLAGKVSLKAYQPHWRLEKTIEVVEGEEKTVTLHREGGVERTVTGKLVAEKGVEANLEKVTIKVGEIDGNYQKIFYPVPEADGTFSFKTKATKIGVFAETPEGDAACIVLTEALEEPVEVDLKPTREYHGRLLDKEGQPLKDYIVVASAHVEEFKEIGTYVHFLAKEVEAKTDARGRFTLIGLPIEQEIRLAAYRDGESKEEKERIKSIYLEPQEKRPLDVIHLGDDPSTPKRTLQEKYLRTFHNASLSGYRVMVLVHQDQKSFNEFVGLQFKDPQTNENNIGFMQLEVKVPEGGLADEDEAFLKSQGWKIPEAGKVFACAIDGEGEELGRTVIDVSEENAPDRAKAFVDTHAPPPHDAREEWDEAFAEAKRSGRRVWMRASGRYCGPCFHLTRWLHRHRSLLEKDYVMLKIDFGRDKNAQEVVERLSGGQWHGVPFHGIFDADETLLIDSVGNLGNIGGISGFEGKRHLRRMLEKTRQKLTDVEVDILVESIDEED